MTPREGATPDDTPPWIKELLDKIHKWDRLGTADVGPGGHNIGLIHVERFGSIKRRWLHVLLMPLLDEEIEEMEAHFGIALPRDFRDFYRHVGGFTLFTYTFIMKSWITKRVGEFGVVLWKYDLREPNSLMGYRGAPKNLFFFGTLAVDGSCNNPLYLDLDTGSIHQCADCESWESRRSWGSLPELLLGEYERLNAEHDELGIRTPRSEDQA